MKTDFKCPVCKDDLQYVDFSFDCMKCGTTYSEKEGVLSLITEEEIKEYYEKRYRDEPFEEEL